MDVVCCRWLLLAVARIGLADGFSIKLRLVHSWPLFLTVDWLMGKVSSVKIAQSLKASGICRASFGVGFSPLFLFSLSRLSLSRLSICGTNKSGGDKSAQLRGI